MKNRQKIIKSFVFIATFACIGFLFDKKVYAQGCNCIYYRCYADNACQTHFGLPYELEYQVPGNMGCCVDSDICHDIYSNSNILCSSCTHGYGNVGKCTPVGSAWGTMCVATCSSGGGAASCDGMGRIDYICDPTNTEGLVFQAWQNVNEYDPDDPTSTRANFLAYTNNITFKSVPSAFCKHWYREQFTGYIDIPAGVKEFRIITDIDHATDDRDDLPGPGECCDGGKQVCGDCEWSWVNCGCGYSTKKKCEDGNWCCSWTAHEPRCSDGYGDNTGVKLGFSNSGGVLAPAGEILNALGTEPPGNPSGLTSIIRSDTTGVQHVFSGNFQGGLYPIQAWYTVSEQNDYEYFKLQWRVPAGSWITVPSSAFAPCLGVTCGADPDAATEPITPTDSEQDVAIPATLTWTAPVSWGETCGVQTNTYTVYANIKPMAGDCLDPGPVNYTALPACTNLAEGTEICSDGFFTVRDTEFCWYVETNNSEFTALSAANGNEVWWFETEDPLTDKQWMTTIYGDFYAASVSMEFPNQIDYIAPWSPPHLSYEDDPSSPDTTDVSSLSSGNIDILTDNSTAGYHPESHSGFYVKNASFAPNQTWPANYRGDPPAGATEISSNCDEIFTSGNLDPDTTYKADASCVNTGISNVSGGNYQLSDDGVVTLYVTGSSDLKFDNEFVSTNQDKRVVFITGEDVDIKIAGSLNSGNPTFGSTPEIEAAFVINKSLEFERKAGDPDPEINPDTSVVVEGPIITKSVLFERNRGLTNFYPSEVIKYNSYYLYKLTSQERKSNESNYSGLFVIDVDWISEE